MNELILKAREEEMILKSEIEIIKTDLSAEGASDAWIYANEDLIKQYVQSTPGQKIGDMARGAGKKFMDWSQNRQTVNRGKNQAAPQQGPVQEGGQAPGGEGEGTGEGVTGGRGVKGLMRNVASTLNPVNLAANTGKAIAGISQGVENLATTGQQSRTGVDPTEQQDLATQQTTSRTSAAGGRLEEEAGLAGKPIANEAPATPAATPAVAPTPDAPPTDADGGAPPTDVDGDSQPDVPATPAAPAVTPAAAPAQTDAQKLVGLNQAKRATDMANTKGGVGTGTMANIATFGLSGALRGGYNAMQRAKGRRAEDAIGRGDTPTFKSFESEQDDLFETIALRKGFQARNTTEALRHGWR